MSRIIYANKIRNRLNQFYKRACKFHNLGKTSDEIHADVEKVIDSFDILLSLTNRRHSWQRQYVANESWTNTELYIDNCSTWTVAYTINNGDIIILDICYQNQMTYPNPNFGINPSRITTNGNMMQENFFHKKKKNCFTESQIRKYVRQLIREEIHERRMIV